MSHVCTRFILLLFFFAFANPSLAAELAYKWKSGETYRFSTNSIDDISMSGMGLSIQDQFTTNSNFAIQIDSVQANGTAEGVVYVESFRVVNKAGHVMASLSEIPKKGLQSLVEIDRKGNFTFKEIIYMVITEKGENLLVSAKVGPNGGTASAQADGEKVTLHAQFDPNTGKMSAGYSIEKIKEAPAKKKKIAIKQDSSKVDILPGKFLEMLKLPEGNIMPGERFSMKAGNMTITTETADITNGSAKLKTSIKTGDGTNKSGDGFGQNMGEMGVEMGSSGSFNMNMGDMNDNDDNDDNDHMDSMDMGGMDMGGMGMGDMGMGDMDMNSMQSMPEMFMNGSFEALFHVDKGMLGQLNGTLSTETKMSGISMKTTTNVTIKRK